MNTERILKLADIIEQSDSFFMHDYYNQRCGTAACIAGHAMHMNMRENEPDPEHPLTFEEWVMHMIDDEDVDPSNDIFIGAMEYLEINGIQADELFMPWITVGDDEGKVIVDHEARFGENGYISKELAAKVLRNLAATGDVDWIGAVDSMKG